ncbi:MAG: EpsG family protein [Bacteroidaceae bacterium]|nr:EpsG family protein [Bacteroidaceae bacterium]
MFDWVTVWFYTEYFDLAVLLLVFLAFWQCHVGTILHKNTVEMNAVWGVMIAVFIILYMGLRPINKEFGDTINYYREFQIYARDNAVFTWEWNTEWLYYNMLHWFSKNGDIHTLFFISAFVYVGSLWLACVRIFKNYYYIPFLVIISMFTFWSYGVNGIRNGLGASIFILALTYANNIPLMLSLILIAVGCHTSVMLMVAAAILAWFEKRTNIYLIGWFLCVVLSYIAGNSIQNYLANMNIFHSDDRFSDYLTGANQVGEKVQLLMTFRWDFLIYSLIGVLVGYYFIKRKNYKDEFYGWLFHIYLTTNAFWVLIIRANYSNRFAQISWFILPLVFIYPFIKKRFWSNHEKMLGFAILIFYAFTFYTNIYKENVFSRVLF